MNQRYSLDTALAQLARCGVKVSGTDILVGRDTGLRAWGAIDYLRKQHGYGVVRL